MHLIGFSLTKLHNEDMRTAETNADLVRKLLTEIFSASLNSGSPCLYGNNDFVVVEVFDKRDNMICMCTVMDRSNLFCAYIFQ